MVKGVKMAIPSWAEEDRPREKLIAKGQAVLSNAELIALLIGSGSTEETAVSLSQRMLSSVDNNLNELFKLGIEGLVKFKGIGEAKAISILAGLELGNRRRSAGQPDRKSIQSSKDAHQIMDPLLNGLKHEEFWVIYLNRANKVIKRENISKGGLSQVIADGKIIFRKAIENLAAAIILCHNHPSLNNWPSEQDKRITKQLKALGELVDIPVVDHLIVTDNTYFSFADEGLL